jgi:hypothetical protein
MKKEMWEDRERDGRDRKLCPKRLLFDLWSGDEQEDIK